MSGEEARTGTIVAGLMRAKKYRHICDDTLHRIAGWALERHPAQKEALKAAKRKLHQVYGAYMDRMDFARLEKRVCGLNPATPQAGLRAACAEILRSHASTAERLPILTGLYPALFRRVGRPGTLLDLACGLNPFALPWMGLGPEVRYRAFDIDRRLVDLVNRFFGRLGYPPGAKCRDILSSRWGLEADVAFLFKTVPCLEQQERGAALGLLRQVRADRVVVSFPARPLGGREKGMVRHYEAAIDAISGELKRPVERIAFPCETFYILGG